MQQIHEIPDKLVVYWDDKAHAIIDVWHNYYVRIDEFQHAVMEKGLNHASTHGGIAWIVDSSEAEGKFGQNILNYIGEDVFPGFVNIGIKYFITIKPKHSPVAAFNVTSYSMKVHVSGLQLIELDSRDAAIDWLLNHQ